MVLEYAGKTKKRDSKWLCQCDCGNKSVVWAQSLRKGSTQSCGCLMRERTIAAEYQAHGKTLTPVYKRWRGIIQRCTNPNSAGFPKYGGNGISVCDRWRKFENFLADMGEPPPGTSIHRINNSGNYEPENCKWATIEEQNRNKGNNYVLNSRRRNPIDQRMGNTQGDKARYPLETTLQISLEHRKSTHCPGVKDRRRL